MASAALDAAAEPQGDCETAAAPRRGSEPAAEPQGDCQAAAAPEGNSEAVAVPRGAGLLETEKYMVAELLSESHYKKIHQALASRWDRLHSLSAAMKLMEEYGVKLTPEEEQRLGAMDEGQQINALVMKMPQQSNEQFQQFFLQLQLLVSTATRVRKFLEEGRPDLVEEALCDAESTGISQYILRMAIVQAGSEVALLREQYINWIKDVDAKCGKLIRGQEDCRTAQMRLAAAQAQLLVHTTSQNDKAKKVMMNFACQSEKGLLSSTFGGWRSWTRTERQEAEIRAEYSGRLEAAEKRLADFKEKQLGNVRGVMMKKAMANDAELRFEIFRTWKDEVKEAVEKNANAHKVKEMEEKLTGMKASQTANTKRVMMRMNGDSDYQLMGMAFTAFLQHHKDYQKDKDFEQAVQKSELKIQEFLKAQSEGAKKVLAKMGGGTDSGLIQQSFNGWREVWLEAKTEAELEAKLSSDNAKLSAIRGKNKDSGMSAMDRSKYHLEQGLLLRLWAAWRLDTRMEASLRLYHLKIEAKRGQLVGVQHMFRRFATELEGSFRAGQDSSRDLRDGPPPGRKLGERKEAFQERRLSKTDGTTSLPDISKPASGRQKEQQEGKLSSGRKQAPSTPSSKVRTPTAHSPVVAEGSPVPPPRAAWH